MRIDSHVHGMHADCNKEGKLIPPLRPIWNTTEKMTPEEHVKGSLKQGIEKVLLLDPAAITFELKEIFGDYVIPAPMVDMDNILPEEIDEMFKRGAVGIKFIAPAKSYGDDSYLPLFEVIRDNHGLAVFHTGYLTLVMFEPGGVMQRSHITDISHMRPMAIDRIARALPDLKILMAHFGNPWWEEALTVIRGHNNIYSDLSGGSAFRRPLEMWRSLFTYEGKLDTRAINKLCFGTDSDAFMPRKYDFKRFIDFYERLYDYLRVPKEIREKINCGNITMLTDLK